MAAMVFVLQDLANADESNRAERSTKGAAAVISLGATLVDMCATTVKIQPRHPIAPFLPKQWSEYSHYAESAAKTAKRFGFSAGVVTALYDLYNSGKSFYESKTTLGVLYGFNGLLGLGIALAGYYGWILYWPLFILSFIVGIAIAIVTTPAVQEWISRCYFSKRVSVIRAQTKGNPPFKPYPFATAHSEFSAFKSAIGA
jgi:hypothetical protein